MPERILSNLPNEKFSKFFALIRILYWAIGAIVTPFCIAALYYIPISIYLSILYMDSTPPPNAIDIFGLWLIPILLWTMLFIMSYISDARVNDKIPESERKAMVLLVSFGALVGLPIYWYLYIWKEPKRPIPNQHQSG